MIAQFYSGVSDEIALDLDKLFAIMPNKTHWDNTRQDWFTTLITTDGGRVELKMFYQDALRAWEKQKEEQADWKKAWEAGKAARSKP